MTHYVIAKFKPEFTPQQKEEMFPAILELFSHTKEIPGITDVSIRTNCVDRPNRYDIIETI